MSLNINEFRAKMKDGGARPNLFKVILAFPAFVNGPTEQLSFLCKSASLPGSTIGKIPTQFRGRTIHWPGDRTFEEWTISVYNATDFALRDAFLEWHEGMNDRELNVASQDIQDLFVDAKVQQLDAQERVIKEYTFKDMWPVSVGNIDLSYDNGDQFETFDVNLEYVSWK